MNDVLCKVREVVVMLSIVTLICMHPDDQDALGMFLLGWIIP